MSRPLRQTVVTLALAGAAAMAWGQGRGIYTCVDAKGRRLTADRPIPECMDREQKEYSPNGTSVRRTVGPTLTAAERAAQDERDRQAVAERQRVAEEKRLQKALLSRYPRQAVHDGERAKALKQVEDAIATGERRIADLQKQHGELVTESEFYKARETWPAKLKRQFEENAQQVAAQKRLIATQEEEKARINARYDEELTKLKVLWAHAGTGQAAR